MRLDRTYEELKLRNTSRVRPATGSLDRTYEELKRDKPVFPCGRMYTVWIVLECYDKNAVEKPPHMK